MSGSPKKRKKKTPHPRTAPAGGSEGAAACDETTHTKVKRRTKATQSAPTIGDPGHKSAFGKRVDEWSRYMHALTPKNRTRTCRSEAMKDKVYALVALTLEATDEGTNDAREPQATSTVFTAEPPEPPDSLEIPADEAAEPEPPDPPDPPGPRRKKQRPNARNRAEEADVERDHDPPHAARNAPRVRFRDREDETDIERDHDPPDLSNPPTKKKGRRGRNR
ncbi:hypothetical protein EV714DRAFT_275229 [Schizophyllum commune]